jgi:hypothetical protein
MTVEPISLQRKIWDDLVPGKKAEPGFHRGRLPKADRIGNIPKKWVVERQNDDESIEECSNRWPEFSLGLNDGR